MDFYLCLVSRRFSNDGKSRFLLPTPTSHCTVWALTNDDGQPDNDDQATRISLQGVGKLFENKLENQTKVLKASESAVFLLTLFFLCQFETTRRENHKKPR